MLGNVAELKSTDCRQRSGPLQFASSSRCFGWKSNGMATDVFRLMDLIAWCEFW